jgi:hypothetical protein
LIYGLALLAVGAAAVYGLGGLFAASACSSVCPSDRALLMHQLLFYAGGPLFAAMTIWAVSVLLGGRKQSAHTGEIASVHGGCRLI